MSKLESSFISESLVSEFESGSWVLVASGLSLNHFAGEKRVLKIDPGAVNSIEAFLPFGVSRDRPFDSPSESLAMRLSVLRVEARTEEEEKSLLTNLSWWRTMSLARVTYE